MEGLFYPYHEMMGVYVLKVVLLAGGLGTRFSEKSNYMPKPMIEIGDMPILWHIMKGYSHYGYREFIICAGYMQHVIKDWFSNYFIHMSDITFDYSNGFVNTTVINPKAEPWKVTIVDTGLNTMTGGRIKRIEHLVKDESFMMTYGDGVCDVNINKLVSFHNGHGCAATLTSVTLEQQKGILDIGEDNTVRAFREKNQMDGYSINAGFMVFTPKIFDYLHNDADVLERAPLEKLAADHQLKCYRHVGFWQCMDNKREFEILQTLWKNGQAPWKSWDD